MQINFIELFWHDLQPKCFKYLINNFLKVILRKITLQSRIEKNNWLRSFYKKNTPTTWAFYMAQIVMSINVLSFDRYYNAIKLVSVFLFSFGCSSFAFVYNLFLHSWQNFFRKILISLFCIFWCCRAVSKFYNLFWY